MRLLTHNMLTCHVKACIATANRIPDKGPLNFPLEIITQEEDMEIVETEFSREFMLHMLQTIDYKALYATSVSLRTVLMNSGQDFPTLPEELPSDVAENEDLLRAIHRIVLGTYINKGELRCQNCGRSYPIQSGIPRMRLEEYEV